MEAMAKSERRLIVEVIADGLVVYPDRHVGRDRLQGRPRLRRKPEGFVQSAAHPPRQKRGGGGSASEEESLNGKLGKDVWKRRKRAGVERGRGSFSWGDKGGERRSLRVHLKRRRKTDHP